MKEGPSESGSRAGLQTAHELLQSRAVVVSVVGKGGRMTRQVRGEKTNASEPLSMRRYTESGIKTGGFWIFQDKPAGYLATGWAVLGVKVA